MLFLECIRESCMHSKNILGCVRESRMLIKNFICLFHSMGARATPFHSKCRSKCTNSVDPFPVLCLLHEVLSVPCVLHAHPFLVVLDGISTVFGPTRACFNVGNKNNIKKTKSGGVVACRKQMTDAKYCIRPMEYTGNGSTEVVHFERRFEGKGVVLALLV